MVNLIDRREIIKGAFKEIYWMSKRFCETQDILVML